MNIEINTSAGIGMGTGGVDVDTYSREHRYQHQESLDRDTVGEKGEVKTKSYYLKGVFLSKHKMNIVLYQ